MNEEDNEELKEQEKKEVEIPEEGSKKGNGTTKIFVLIIIISIVLGIFIISNISISISLQEDIKELSRKNAELQKSLMEFSDKSGEQINEYSALIKKQLDEQSNLIYKLMGNDNNIIIPEQYISSFRNLKENVDTLGECLNKASYDDVIVLYNSFIDETPSWIKENLQKELNQVVFNMEYYKILLDYESNKDLKTAIDDLHKFIMKNKDYEYLSDVIEFRNQLLDLENIESKNKN